MWWQVVSASYYQQGLWPILKRALRKLGQHNVAQTASHLFSPAAELLLRLFRAIGMGQQRQHLQ